MKDMGDIRIYEALQFPEPPSARPYIYIDMVTTIDGKTVSGSRDEDVLDLGSKVDHLLMRRIEEASDAVLIGGQTLRATSPKWNPPSTYRIVVSRSGHLPFDKAYMSNGEPIIAAPEGARLVAESPVRVLTAGQAELDWHELMRKLRQLGISHLLVLGGSEVNAELLSRDMVDELFVTISPKVKLGRHTPTYAGGDPLPQGALQTYDLLESHVIDDEVFLRYRRERNQ